MEQHCPGGHIHFSDYFVTKSHIESYIDRAGIPAGRKRKSSKSSYTSSAATLPELSLRLPEIHTIHICKHRPLNINKFLLKIFMSSLNFPLIISVYYSGIRQVKS